MRYKHIVVVTIQHLQEMYLCGQTSDVFYEDICSIEWSVVVFDGICDTANNSGLWRIINSIKRNYSMYSRNFPFNCVNLKPNDFEYLTNWVCIDENMEWNEIIYGDNLNKNIPIPYMCLYPLKDFRTLDIKSTYLKQPDSLFTTDDNGCFIHNDEVKSFLDMMAVNEALPFSSKETRNLLTHSLWVLPNVNTVIAMKEMLEHHCFFRGYRIFYCNEKNISSCDLSIGLRKKIKNSEKSISLICLSQLSSLIVPEWSAVFVMTNIESRTDYIHIINAVQQPCMYRINGKSCQKHHSFIFDFNPSVNQNIIKRIASDAYGCFSDVDGKNIVNALEFLISYIKIAGNDENGNFDYLSAKQINSVYSVLNEVNSSDNTGIVSEPSLSPNDENFDTDNILRISLEGIRSYVDDILSYKEIAFIVENALLFGQSVNNSNNGRKHSKNKGFSSFVNAVTTQITEKVLEALNTKDELKNVKDCAYSSIKKSMCQVLQIGESKKSIYIDEVEKNIESKYVNYPKDTRKWILEQEQKLQEEQFLKNIFSSLVAAVDETVIRLVYLAVLFDAWKKHIDK